MPGSRYDASTKAKAVRLVREHATYWARRSAAPGKRQLWDTAVTEILAGIYEPDENGRRPPESLYGTVKMWAYLNRQGIPVAKCTVERLKCAHGWRGATRGRRVRATVADPAAARAPDLVRRQFKASRPGQLHVADFTYVPLAGGRFAYTAFVIGAFAGLIPAGNAPCRSRPHSWSRRSARQRNTGRGKATPSPGTPFTIRAREANTPACISPKH